MSNSQNLVSILRHRAAVTPQQKIYTFLGDGETESASLTYQELDLQARVMATQLLELGATGERALLLYPPSLEFITAFFGCLYAGVIAVPAYPPKRNQYLSRLQAIVKDSQATIVLSTRSVLKKLNQGITENQELAKLQLLASDWEPKELPDWKETPVDLDSLAFLQYTSGSTGTPKGVMVSHGNIMHNQKMIAQAFGHNHDTVFVGWLPLFHDMGLIGNVLQPIYLGRPCILMSPVAFVQKPLRWLQAISRYQATTSGGPNFAYDLCVNKIAPQELTNLDLSSWTVAFNGAEPIQSNTLERFADYFNPCGFRPEAFYPCYGMAETTLFVSGSSHEKLPKILAIESAALKQNQVVVTNNQDQGSQKLVGCGYPWLEQEIKIVNPQSLSLSPANQVGEIWVKGQSVAQGYWNKKELTQEFFRAKLSDSSLFLRTGDLGFIYDGQLFITGRIKDLIIIRGENYYPQDLEQTISNSHSALRPGYGAVFTFSVESQERLVVTYEVKRQYLRHINVEEVNSCIVKAIAQEYELQVYAILLLKTGSIPKTSSGKIQRHTCQKGFLEGSLQVVSQWQQKFSQTCSQAIVTADRQQTIQNWLLLKIAHHLNINAQEIDIHQPLINYGLDSLAAMTISGDLQEWLGYPLPPTLLYDYPSLASIAYHLTINPDQVWESNIQTETETKIPTKSSPADSFIDLSLIFKKTWQRKIINFLRLEKLLLLSQLNETYHAIIKNPQVESYQTILEHLKVSWQVGDQDLAKIPRKGAVVIVANHPCGGIEGIILLSILRSIRPDVKANANFLLNRIPQSEEIFILTDPYKNQKSKERNTKTLQEISNWLGQGHMLVIFPACAVSRFGFIQGKVVDAPWRPSVARLIRATKSTVVPIYFDASNTLMYSMACFINPRLRIFLLPREIIKQSQKTLKVKVGKPIFDDDSLAQQFPRDLELIDYLRQCTYGLNHRD